VSFLGPDKTDQFAERHDAGGIEVACVFESQDDDLEVGVGDEALDLGLKEFGGSEEEGTFDVDDGNAGIGALLFAVKFTELSLLGDFIFYEVGFRDLAKEEENGEGDADKNGDIKLEDEGAEEGEKKDSGIFGGGAEADSNVAGFHQGGGDSDDESGEGALWDVGDRVGNDEGEDEDGDATHESGKDGGHGAAGP